MPRQLPGHAGPGGCASTSPVMGGPRGAIELVGQGPPPGKREHRAGVPCRWPGAACKSSLTWALGPGSREGLEDWPLMPGQEPAPGSPVTSPVPLTLPAGGMGSPFQMCPGRSTSLPWTSPSRGRFGCDLPMGHQSCMPALRPQYSESCTLGGTEAWGTPRRPVTKVTPKTTAFLLFSVLL